MTAPRLIRAARAVKLSPDQAQFGRQPLKLLLLADKRLMQLIEEMVLEGHPGFQLDNSCLQ
jgi:hypothetical protein